MSNKVALSLSWRHMALIESIRMSALRKYCRVELTLMSPSDVVDDAHYLPAESVTVQLDEANVRALVTALEGALAGFPSEDAAPMPEDAP